MLSYPYLFDEGSLEGGGVDIVTWADGTDEEIVAMISAADEGEITLTDYWSVGDERTFSLDAIPGDSYGAFPTAMAAQNIVMVLMNEGYMEQEGIHFVVGQKDCLNQFGRMNNSSTNSGSWKGCSMRVALNGSTSGGYYYAFADTIKSIFKDFVVTTSASYSSGSANTTCVDKFALFAEREVFNSGSYSVSGEARALSQITYYETSVNRIKYCDAYGGNCSWWERSPLSGNQYYFCKAGSNAGYGTADNNYGVAPFGCI